MGDLLRRIQQAQVEAGERAVIDDLAAKGLVAQPEASERPDVPSSITLAGDVLVKACHGAAFSAGWWKSPVGRDLADLIREPESAQEKLLAGALVAQKLCLVHSEISEAMEGHRKGLMDDHLPHRKMIEVELADAIIRICDLAGALNLHLGGAIAEKLAYNARRPDHKLEARAAAGGKAY